MRSIMKREIEYHDVSTANLEEKRVLKILEQTFNKQNVFQNNSKSKTSSTVIYKY